MKDYKAFLINACKIENLTVKELMELTGKSQSVVYSWLSYSKPDFPTIESLGKILFRLGITFDDFINYRCSIYDNGKSARIYYRYNHGAYDYSYIGVELLDSPNAEDIIKTYLLDRNCLNNMIIDCINGVEIDVKRFDLLCKTLMPVFVSGIITDAEETVHPLNSSTIDDYKLGVRIIEESEEDNDGEPDFDKPNHYIYYPNAHNVILLAADSTPSFIDDYLTIIDEQEKSWILDVYMEICEHNPNYDKNNNIIKRLLKNNCTFLDSKDIKEKYHNLTKRILKVQ